MKWLINFFKLIFFWAIILAIGIAYASGMRVNPSALTQLGIQHNAPYYRMESVAGEVMFARVLQEQSDALRVQLRAKTFRILKTDLRDYRPVTGEERNSKAFDAWRSRDLPEPFISWNASKNIFKKYAWIGDKCKELMPLIQELQETLKTKGWEGLVDKHPIKQVENIF